LVKFDELEAKRIPELNSCTEEDSVDSSFSCDLSESNSEERLTIFSNAKDEFQPQVAIGSPIS